MEKSFAAARRLADHALLLEEFLVPGEPMDVWTWLASMSTSRRRKALLRAHHSLVQRGEYHRKFSEISAFVKTELLPYFGIGPAGVDRDRSRYVARLIQAPHDETHIVAGPWLKPLTHRLKHVWNVNNWIFYASVAPELLDVWLQRNCAAVSWFWSDYSSFDATYSEEAWAMIESFYETIYPEAPLEFWEVMDIWRHPHGKIRMRCEDQKIEYHAGVCNASGRDDTALANALLNGIVLSISFAAALAGKDVSDVNSEDLHAASQLAQIAVVGDDSLVACSFDVSQYSAVIQRNIETFGLVVKAEMSHSLVDVTFLGMMPYMVAGTFHWGPTIGRRLYKAFWQAKPIGNLPAWTRGVAQQLKLFANVPILFDVAAKVDQLLHGGAVTKVSADENKVWQSISTTMPHWDSSTIDWVCARYAHVGLTPALIQQDLNTIERIVRLPAVVRLESLELILQVDDL
jgi:hypothetical protein